MKIIRKLTFIKVVPVILCVVFLANFAIVASAGNVPVGATIPLTASNASDSDCDYTGGCPESVPDNDGFTYTWSVTWTVGGGSAGTFPGSNVGQSVHSGPHRVLRVT